MFFDSIFVVNLLRRPDRWKSITSEMQKSSLLPSHKSVLNKVAAYDGSLFSTKTISDSHLVSSVGLDRYQNLPQDQKVWGMDMSAGAIGCALSHVDIWCSVVEQNLQRALILEDDTIMSEDFLEQTQHVFESVPKDWECLFLSGLDPEQQCKYLRVKKTNKNTNKNKNRFICRVPRIYRTTNCYVINAKGAATLLSLCVPFTFQLDTAMTTMLVDPSTATTRKGTAVDSSLEEEEEQEQDHHQKSEFDKQSLRTEYVTLMPSYCVDPPLCAQATRFGTDIQWKNPNTPEAGHDFEDEEKSRLKAAGIIV